MIQWIRNLLPAKKTEPRSEAEELLESVATRVDYDDSIVVRFDRDKLGDAAEDDMAELFSEFSDMNLFEGTVEHGYALAAVGHSDQCPRCQSETEQLYGNFIYASEPSPRIMLAPAGYFCTNCPTVIVDEVMLSRGVVGNFPFNGIVGTSSDGEEPAPFQTWNGQEPVYIFDETGNISGLSAVPRAGFRRSSGTKTKRPKTKQNTQLARKKQAKKKRKRK